MMLGCTRYDEAERERRMEEDDREMRRALVMQIRALLRDDGLPEPIGMDAWRQLALDASVDGVEEREDLTYEALRDIFCWCRRYCQQRYRTTPASNILPFRPRAARPDRR